MTNVAKLSKRPGVHLYTIFMIFFLFSNPVFRGGTHGLLGFQACIL